MARPMARPVGISWDLMGRSTRNMGRVVECPTGIQQAPATIEVACFGPPELLGND